MEANPSDDLESRRGDEVKLLGSTAKKHRGLVAAWLDTGKRHTAHFYHIIVEMPDPDSPGNTYYDAYKAAKCNVTHVDPPPSNYTEAAFQQIPQLEERLTDFAKMVAKCRVPVDQFLLNKIAAVCADEIRKQLVKGSKADYKLVDTTGVPNVVPDDETGV